MPYVLLGYSVMLTDATAFCLKCNKTKAIILVGTREGLDKPLEASF